MTLKEFAILSGVRIERCHKEWGGTWAYKTTKYPDCLHCGFKSEEKTYERWAEVTFGKDGFEALKKLFEQSK